MTRRALREISEIARKLAENESRPCTAFSRNDRFLDRYMLAESWVILTMLLAHRAIDGVNDIESQ